VSAGFVYLIREGERYKIGKSIDPASRLLQVSPGGVLVHVIASTRPREVEATLHRRFARQRVPARGPEWFLLSAEDLATICLLARTDSAADLPPDLQAGTNETVRVDAELMEMARFICFHRKVGGKRLKLTQFVDGILRGPILKQFAELQEQLGTAAPPAAPKGKGKQP
jgi:hypothetical protein